MNVPASRSQAISRMKDGQVRYFPVRRILLSRLRFMGDIILTTPLVTALKHHFPHVEIDYLAESPYSELLLHHPGLTNVFSFERSRYDRLPLQKSIRAQWQLVESLRQRKYDLAIDLLGIPRSAFLLRFTGAPLRVGGCFRYRSHLFTHCFDSSVEKWRTAIDFHFLALKRLGISPVKSMPEVYLQQSENEWAQSYLRQKGIQFDRAIVGLHPGATWQAKMWRSERFVELANRLVTELKVDVIITHGPGDKPVVEEMKRTLNEQVKILDLLSLRQLASVLAQLSVYISNDCGPMHLAPAVDTPTIGIFGLSEPDIWFPYPASRGHYAMIKPIDCRPCHQNECPIQHQCMDWISVDEVFAKTRQILSWNPVK